MKRSNKETKERALLVHQKDVFFRPNREKYLRRSPHNSKCVFCVNQAKGVSSSSLVLYRSREAMVVVNKFPYNSGHVMVLPTRHAADPTDLSDRETIAVARLLKWTLAGLRGTYSCQGINVGLNLGAVSGAGIPGHLHYHVIPRWAGDTNFFPLMAGAKVVIETPSKTFKKLRGFFRNLPGDLMADTIDTNSVIRSEPRKKKARKVAP